MNLYILATDTCYGVACPIGDYDAYQEIYALKDRGYNKPLAVMVADLDWLYDYTDLSEEQLNFISEYKYPYTVLADCHHIKMLLQFEDEEVSYPNHEQYQKIAFRIAHTDTQKKLIAEEGPIFLTSANQSGDPESLSEQDVQSAFGIKLNKMNILDTQTLSPPQISSDIFEFTGDSLEVNYLRKNS